jgi:RNA polymerase sigma factor (sigma-70 family)
MESHLASQVTDIHAILIGCANQDRICQRDFYKKFYGYAMSICTRYTTVYDEALELANDGFLKIFRALPNFKIESGEIENQLLAWIKKIMINTCIDFIRAKKNKIIFSSISDSSHSENPVSEDYIIEKFSINDILVLINNLSPSYKTIFNLFVIDGYTHEQIASMLQISVGTSKSNLFKARQHLQNQLKKTELSMYEK